MTSLWLAVLFAVGWIAALGLTLTFWIVLLWVGESLHDRHAAHRAVRTAEKILREATRR